MKTVTNSDMLNAAMVCMTGDIYKCKRCPLAPLKEQYRAEMCAQSISRFMIYMMREIASANAKKEDNEADQINHPSHYTYGKHECIDEMQILFGREAVIDYCKLAAYKYKYRQGHKGTSEDAKRDREKADWYISKAEELQNGFGSAQTGV